MRLIRPHYKRRRRSGAPTTLSEQAPRTGLANSRALSGAVAMAGTCVTGAPPVAACDTFDGAHNMIAA